MPRKARLDAGVYQNLMTIGLRNPDNYAHTIGGHKSKVNKNRFVF
jgi:hypothetical protein